VRQIIPLAISGQAAPATKNVQTITPSPDGTVTELSGV
jgi:hypothetical protein